MHHFELKNISPHLRQKSYSLIQVVIWGKLNGSEVKTWGRKFYCCCGSTTKCSCYTLRMLKTEKRTIPSKHANKLYEMTTICDKIEQIRR